MDLRKKSICFVASYAAPYGGNFIKMLQALAGRLKNNYACHIYFLFPMQPEKDWLVELSKKYVVGFVGKKNVSAEFYKFFDKWRIDLVHTHFETYDIPVAKAVKKNSRQICQVWHIHDYMSLDKTGLTLPHIRKFFTNQRLWRQYGKWGKEAYFISVSDEMAHFVNHYRTHQYKYPSRFNCLGNNFDKLIRTTVVINGIDINRISQEYTSRTDHNKFSFLSFGGESVSKGISTILDACDMLSQTGISFRLYLTEGYTTTQLLTARFGDSIPVWLEVIKQTNNISELLSKSDCYISASRRETMSMAIAEASLFGLPVIQSDIPGTMWNASSPSTFLFPVDNSEALYDAMIKVIGLTKSGEMHKLTAQTKDINYQKLSMNLWISKIIDVYKLI